MRYLLILSNIRLHSDFESLLVSRAFEPLLMFSLFSLSKKLYNHCLVLVGSRNGLERDLHIKAKPVCFTIELK